MTVTMTTGLVPIHHLELENIRNAKLRAKRGLIEKALREGYAEPSWGESSWAALGRDAIPSDWMGGSISNIFVPLGKLHLGEVMPYNQ